MNWQQMNIKKNIIIIAITAVISSFLTIATEFFLLGLDVSKLENVIRFVGALRFIELRYVDTVNYSKLMDGAINGMVKSLDDPHSIYLDANLYKRLIERTEGSFGGIGVYMGFKDNKVQIVSVIEGTPGAKAGLKANDEIVAVDGTQTSEMQPEEVAMHVRGEIGTDVSLTIHREGETDKDYIITRDSIKVQTTSNSMLDGDLGYIRIASFSEDTANEFKAAYNKLVQEGMNGIIIDLRSNPGGLVNSVVDIANMVVPKGLVVSTVQRDGSKEEYFSELTESKYPIVVLIDGNSASASEILAGALQDTHAATIVGEKSYGKGSIQAVMPMFHDDALKLTVAKYYTPNGNSIDGTGVKPDVEVTLDVSGTEDNQLIKAKEVLRDKINAR